MRSQLLAAQPSRSLHSVARVMTSHPELQRTRRQIPRPLARQIAVALLAAGCAAPDPVTGPMHVEFLTRDGCGGSEDMRANLDAALSRLGPGVTLVVIDVDTLAPDDPRTGYGTPTILRDGRELFGLLRPAPAAPT